MADFIKSWESSPWRKKGKILWRMCLLAVWWFLWKEKNARVFEGKSRSSYGIYVKLIAAVISWARSLPLFRFVSAFDLWKGWAIICMEGVSKVTIRQSWIPPSQELMKLNFDGLSLGNPGEAGIGGLYRINKGEVLWAFSGPIGVADLNEAEVRAVHRGIKLMDSQAFDKTIVEGDSLNVFRWLSGEAIPPWRFLPFFEEIEDCLRALPLCSVMLGGQPMLKQML
ncbi:uncharacterized protein LOC143886063 [Tasmannia lanceolata]|uniref:uncharacterized protein LOC143886063 n=1 Tax=Tasmannia lanceolata TaxID=3420 RepID=UPI004062AE50